MHIKQHMGLNKDKLLFQMTLVSAKSDQNSPTYKHPHKIKIQSAHTVPQPRNSKNQQPQKLESVSHLDWNQTIPNKQTLLQTGFGQPSLAHSFNQEACFETVLLFIIKSGHSNPCDTFNHLLAHPLHAHLASAVVNLSDYNFTWLRDYNLHWATQTMMNRSKSYAFLAWEI